MITGFEKIVEDRIKQAQKKGAFEHLPGSGQPLSLENDHFVSEELRLAYKILKNADYLPPEIELKREIRVTEDLLSGMTETAEKYRTVKKLNYLIMKLNSMRNTSFVFDIPQKYALKLVERFGVPSLKGKKDR
ncbi:MAG TPA: DUF1992 domain-containing protein [Desulfobacterales bacterium]|nr:DUF1992 domain-containing protein [Desulfobacterales bacterium]